MGVLAIESDSFRSFRDLYLSNDKLYTTMDKDIRLNDHGVNVEIVIQTKDNHPGQLGVRHVNISGDLFYTEDLRGFVEDVENDGTVILKDEILIRQGSPIPILEYTGPIYLDDNYLKVPPYICYIPGNTLVGDALW
jgi:hypothetical protein